MMFAKLCHGPPVGSCTCGRPSRGVCRSAAHLAHHLQDRLVGDALPVLSAQAAACDRPLGFAKDLGDLGTWLHSGWLLGPGQRVMCRPGKACHLKGDHPPCDRALKAQRPGLCPGWERLCAFRAIDFCTPGTPPAPRACARARHSSSRVGGAAPRPLRPALGEAGSSACAPLTVQPAPLSTVCSQYEAHHRLRLTHPTVNHGPRCQRPWSHSRVWTALLMAKPAPPDHRGTSSIRSCHSLGRHCSLLAVRAIATPLSIVRLLPKQTIMPQPQIHRHEKPPIPWTSISMSKKREAVHSGARPGFVMPERHLPATRYFAHPHDHKSQNVVAIPLVTHRYSACQGTFTCISGNNAVS